MSSELDPEDAGPSQERAEHRQRDGASLKIIGGFFTFFSILVLIGTFWEERAYGIAVNLTAGLLLLAVGLGMFLGGRRLSRR